LISTLCLIQTNGKKIHVVSKDGVVLKCDGYVFTGQRRQEAINNYEHYVRNRR
jgi:hypothetical protein